MRSKSWGSLKTKTGTDQVEAAIRRRLEEGPPGAALTDGVDNYGGGIVIRVVDGDTIIVNKGGREERVRLLGIDGPELCHPKKPMELGAMICQAGLERLCLGEWVGLECDTHQGDRDRYERLLRYAVRSVDGLDVGLEMVRGGHAHCFRKYPHGRQKAYFAAEASAREIGLGIWARCWGGAVAVVGAPAEKEAGDGEEPGGR